VEKQAGIAARGRADGTPSTGPGEMMGNAGPGMLQGLRVIEIADERAEYCGLLLAGLGAEVIKIEPPDGNATRRIGPFLGDEPGRSSSGTTTATRSRSCSTCSRPKGASTCCGCSKAPISCSMRAAAH
jgi:hypothetical protein